MSVACRAIGKENIRNASSTHKCVKKSSAISMANFSLIIRNISQEATKPRLIGFLTLEGVWEMWQKCWNLQRNVIIFYLKWKTSSNNLVGDNFWHILCNCLKAASQNVCFWLVVFSGWAARCLLWCKDKVVLTSLNCSLITSSFGDNTKKPKSWKIFENEQM